MAAVFHPAPLHCAPGGRSAGYLCSPNPFAYASAGYFTRLLSLKIGRMIDIAMKPTTLPISTIISGSIIAVQLLMTVLSSLE